MRATARNAFQRHIEACEYDAQELACDEAEGLLCEYEQEYWCGEREEAEEVQTLEQELTRIALIAEEPERVRAVATLILGCFELQSHVERFLACPDGLAILANCCNAAAKWHDPELYGHKPTLINLATAQHPECWQCEGVVYIETCVGQVSFHALYGEDTDLPEAQGRVWSELEYQANADIVALAFVEGWSKELLQQRIGEKCAAVSA